MSGVLAPAAPAGSARTTLRRSPLAGLGRRHAYMILGFSAGVPLVYILFALAIGEEVRAAFVAYEVATIATLAMVAQLCALAADNVLRHRMGNASRVALTVAAASIVGLLLLHVVNLILLAPLELDRLLAENGKQFDSAMQHQLYLFAGALRWSLVLVVLYELLETHRRTQSALHSVRLSALAAERDLVEGELRTMQARVDPDLLFDSLLDIDRAYARDLSAGQAQLDALIRYLRAALPGDGNGGSNVGREQDLVEAYVDLLNERGAHRVALEISVEPAVRRQAIPAMLLLPLTRWALAAGGGGQLSVTIETPPGALKAVVKSDVSGAAPAVEKEISAVHERLRQLYVSGARLQVSTSGDTRHAELTVPR